MQSRETVMRHVVDIACGANDVLAYAGSPDHWPVWHPSSLAIQGPAGPVQAGARFEEDIRAGGRTGHLQWEVLAYVPARRWQARATGDQHGLRLTVTYDTEDIPGGTRFTRTLAYQMDGLVMRLLNRCVLRKRIERESAESLRQLRVAIEQEQR